MKFLIRLRELHRSGGPREVLRGIHDFVWWRGPRRAQLAWYRDLGRPYTTTLCGERFAVIADSNAELNRAAHLRNEEEAAAALFEVDMDKGLLGRITDPILHFWDIGAHSGMYSLIARRKGLSVTAFDPHPWSIARFVRNHDLNDLEYDIRPVALSDLTGPHTFTYGGEDDTPNQFSVSGDGDLQAFAVRGDDIEAPDPDLVKIDVEGHEMEVLHGMADTLDRSVRRVLVEVHANVDQVEVTTALDDHAFTCSVYDRGEEAHVLGRREGWD